LITATVAVVVVVLAVIGPRLAYATFDPELAALSGVPVATLEYTLLALTALVVVVGVKTVGVVLVSAFVVIPAATANLLGQAPARIAALAVAIGGGGTAFGLFVSYHLNVATGATIILTLGTLFFLAVARQRR
jgi:zinc transport system permease protein